MKNEKKITIIHLAVEYNTPYRAKTTPAVEWFVDELDEFNNIVIAMRRSVKMVNRTRKCPQAGREIYDFPYFGLPLGINLHNTMRNVAKRIIALIEHHGIIPDVIHAHKFSIEGLAGFYVASHFNIPLFTSLRGEVEIKIHRFKPLLRSKLREIAAYATRLLFVSAWFENEFRRYNPGYIAKERRLPNIVRNVKRTIDIRSPNDHFIAVMNLDTYKRKGLRWLLDAVVLAHSEEPRLRLELVGGGEQRSVDAVAKMIGQRGLNKIVKLAGQISNAELLEKMPNYRGLALPSLNETFGMVYVEALFSGIPIIYTKGSAIDGYLENLDVGISVEPRNIKQICSALLTIWRDNDKFRENISNSAEILFKSFDLGAHINAYSLDVQEICRQTSSIDAN